MDYAKGPQNQARGSQLGSRSGIAPSGIPDGSETLFQPARPGSRPARVVTVCNDFFLSSGCDIQVFQEAGAVRVFCSQMNQLASASKAKTSVLSELLGLENVLFNDFIDDVLDSEDVSEHMRKNSRFLIPYGMKLAFFKKSNLLTTITFVFHTTQYFHTYKNNFIPTHFVSFLQYFHFIPTLFVSFLQYFCFIRHYLLRGFTTSTSGKNIHLVNTTWCETETSKKKT
jgi:hypothetical protein